MGRIRTIKPEFFRHERLFDLEQEASLPIRLAFAGLWTSCDREGRFKWRPRTLKAEILPFDDCDFARVLDALDTHGFVVRYEVQGEQYGCIPSWNKHQFINNREQASTIPPPPEDTVTQTVDASTTCEAHDEHTDTGERKGKESNEERKGTLKKTILAQAPLVLTAPAIVPIGTWLAFVEMRKKIRRPMTDHAADLIHRKLHQLKEQGHDPVEVLEQSIRNGWQDVFPPREEKQQGRGDEPKSFDQMRNDRTDVAIKRILQRSNVANSQTVTNKGMDRD